MKAKLIKMLYEKSFKHTEKPTFKLASGRLSRYYVNCKSVTLHPVGMALVGQLIHMRIRDFSSSNPPIDGVGGLTFGADPIAIATAYTSYRSHPQIKAFSIRKEVKDHGIPNWIEGDLPKGSRVAIIDDVATTGGSTIKAITRARESGLNVVMSIILVDRQEGGLENIKKHVHHVSSIVTRDDLLAYSKTVK